MERTPPALPSSRRKWFTFFAQASWASIILCFIVNFGMKAVLVAGDARTHTRLTGIVACVLIVFGVVSGIIALCGVPRHGAKGILWPALAGLLIWILLIGLGIPTFLKARERALAARQRAATPPTSAIHVPGTTRVVDKEGGYAFDLPEGYQPIPDTKIPPGFRRGYFLPSADGLGRILLVKHLGALIGRERLQLSQLPKGKSLSVSTLQWRGITVDAIHVPEKNPRGDFLTINVQIPLRGEAIQIGFGGPSAAEPEIRAVAERVLASLDGEPNP